MGIKRYLASKDNTITNAFKSDLVTRGTGSNMGASDIIEVFNIYAQASSSLNGYSKERSRILIEFPIQNIVSDRNNGLLPASGSVKFYLRLFNAKHPETVPDGATLVIAPISSSWDEGYGMDMEDYSDAGYSNWISSSNSVAWTSQGGDYLSSPRVQQTFEEGTEDLEVDVSDLAEQWLNGTKQNYGFGIFLTSSQEDATDRSYYTKRFFARGTEFFYKRPIIEARFNDSVKDKRGDFYYSSSLATSAENLNTIYLYNNVRGALRNIPSVGTGNIYVSIFSSSNDLPTGSAINLVPDGTNVTTLNNTVVTGGWIATGVYTASFCMTGNMDTIHDVWHNGNLTQQYFTSSISPKVLFANNSQINNKNLVKITNLKSQYYTDETSVIRLYSRPRNWYPNIYTVARDTPETSILHSASYSVYRMVDNFRVIPHGTGSTLHTLMSYDVSGNYFNFDMNLLEPDYAYGFEIAIYNDNTNSWDVQPETFKFRVEKRQTE